MDSVAIDRSKPHTTSISSATKSCRESLEYCLETRFLQDNGWAENRLADFNLWDAGLGASSDRRASLEDRLMLKPHVGTAILNLLTVFRLSVDLCRELALLHDQLGVSATPTAPKGEVSEVIQESLRHDDDAIRIEGTTLSVAIENANFILNDLARLGALIRKAGASSRFVKADNSFRPEDPTHSDLREHLSQIILRRPASLEAQRRSHWESIDLSLSRLQNESREECLTRAHQDMNWFTKQAQSMDTVQSRLLMANLRRSNRFMYSQRHGEKLESLSRSSATSRNKEVTNAIPTDPDQIKSSDCKPGNSKQDGYDHLHQVIKEPKDRKPVHNVATDTTASAVQTEILSGLIKLPIPSQQATTTVSTTGSRIHYPQPPRIREDARVFTCPCCCVSLPSSFSETQRWRKHIKEDVLPYTCILSQCNDPDTLYADKVAWMDHMFNDHDNTSYWQCVMCDDGTNHYVESDFVKHLSELHPGAISNDRIQIFLEVCSRRGLTEVTTCPLCNWAEDAQEPVSTELILDHIAEHIHGFSLRSLPWAPNTREENSETFTYSCAKVEQWWAARFPDQEGSGHVPALQTTQDNQNFNPYFYAHEYFAESSGASSLAIAISDDGNLSDASDESTETQPAEERRSSGRDTDTTRATSTLCGLCHRMLSNWHEYEANADHKFDHHESSSALKRSALELECALCYQFYKGFAGEHPTRRMGAFGQVSVQMFDGDLPQRLPMEKVLNLSLNVANPPTNPDGEVHTESVYYAVKMLPAKHNRSSPSNTNTKKSLDLAAKWLHECMASHPKCNQHAKPKLLPTRLIAIDETELRLCTSKDISEHLQYGTLSYCWGQTQPFRLVQHNCNQMYRSISPESLTQTIRDAIEIAQALGISYLWVDSLCIIQDSPDDWRHEASRMTDIFSGSNLNIAATSARDCKGGCFFNRPEYLVCQADVHSKDYASLYDFVPDDYISVSLGSEPLLSRAWILQERLLSPRTLHFTKTEIFWECYHTSASETFPDGIPTALRKASTFEKKPPDHTMWSWIVEEYTRCHLTYSSDKQVAILGIAQEVQSNSEGKYVAGMWQHDLAIQLCWFIGGIAENRPLNHKAPTWSWLSTTGRVSYPRSDPSYRSGNETIWINVLEIKLEQDKPDLPRVANEGSLFLRCNMLLHIDLAADGMLFTNTGKRLECSIYLDAPQSHVQGICAVPILSRQDGSLVQGLLLELVDKEVNTYQRLGMFRVHGKVAQHKFEEAASKHFNLDDNESVEIEII